jgi:bacterioferritin
MAHCEAVQDYVSRDLLQRILNDTEAHIDYTKPRST